MKDNPNHINELTRREFIRVGAAGATGVALAGLGGLASSARAETGAPAKLPRRRYGRTGLEISTLVGAADWSTAIIPLAVEQGVNYWHKAHRWTAETMPAAIKSQPRESYYLEVVVDRVGGDHMKGHIDEEQHYQFVKQCVARSGVGYYDVFKFHFGYHSVEEAKTEPGMVRAYERLKKEGLVKHLALSQHHYNNIGGDMAYDVIDYLVENSPYEAAQFFYTYGDKKQIEDCIALAGKKDFGVIAMKTMGGVGRAAEDKKFQALLDEPRFKGSTPAAAMVKWLMSNPNLTAAVIATSSFDQLQENFGAAKQGAVTAGDRETLNLLAAYNKGLTCLLCADCVSHCPEHIAIADILRYERYAMDYHDLGRARAEYQALTKNGTACIACGDCLPGCPADINVVAKLKQVHALLG
ncbi:MAG TPA: aldo/keto reductase [Candidatus Acidoferrum sp.]|nr:aldo/keto reductase [Candidatus Acidoferrum sp.]